MKTLTHPGTQGTAAYGNGLMIAAALSMQSSIKNKRYSVWMTPAGGTGRGLAESDPRHREAVSKATAEGALNGARARWTDEAGNRFVVQEA